MHSCDFREEDKNSAWIQSLLLILGLVDEIHSGEVTQILQ